LKALQPIRSGLTAEQNKKLDEISKSLNMGYNESSIYENIPTEVDDGNEKKHLQNLFIDYQMYKKKMYDSIAGRQRYH
jgi:hypothetical protein